MTQLKHVKLAVIASQSPLFPTITVYGNHQVLSDGSLSGMPLNYSLAYNKDVPDTPAGVTSKDILEALGDQIFDTSTTLEHLVFTHGENEVRALTQQALAVIQFFASHHAMTVMMRNNR